MSHALRYDVCPLCKGSKRSKPVASFTFTFGGSAPADIELVDDDCCPRCSGTGTVCMPPFGDGSKARITDEKMSELASAGTLLRCIDQRLFVEAVANQAAHITLPAAVIKLYVSYWADPGRDVTLGDYIRQIAEYAEDLALASHGSLDNGLLAGPRRHKITSH